MNTLPSYVDIWKKLALFCGKHRNLQQTWCLVYGRHVRSLLRLRNLGLVDRRVDSVKASCANSIHSIRMLAMVALLKFLLMSSGKI